VASRATRSGVLVVRVWTDVANGPELRARLTRTLDVARGEAMVITAATREQVVADVQTWLDDFLTSAAVTHRSRRRNAHPPTLAAGDIDEGGPMSDDMLEAADHGGIEPLQPGVGGEATPSPVGSPFVPMAEAISSTAEGAASLIPSPEGTGGPVVGPISQGIPWPGGQLPHACNINLRAGCYRITFTPKSGLTVFNGTMRVDDQGGKTTISGDLYRYLRISFPVPFPRAQTVLESPTHTDADTAVLPKPIIGPIVSPGLFPRALGIPIYPRNRYYSYLRVTNIQRPPLLTFGPCQLTLTAQEYIYTQPPAGSFNGTFPAAPGSRTVQIVLEPRSAPAGFTSSYFEGTLYEGGVAQGTFTMGWVSSFYRKATVEIDTLTGAVAPQAVGTEDMRSVFANAGWNVRVVYDQTNIPVPAGVTATACWSNADLHALMTSVRNPSTNLDTEWRMHLVVVPAAMGCGRGVMYDTIGVPREGVASFSDDGYPTAQSSNFGTAANKKQRDTPRAFLRSACHEVGHGFNQIHQEQEAGADNSIMTTTPSVADVLGGPATGAPGVFPDQINLAFNDHVRHHLVHFPDIVVRPGGLTFGSGHSSSVPEADRYFFEPDELELTLAANESRVELGEPVELRWTLTNRSRRALPVPSDIGIEAQHAFVSVTDPRGRQKLMPSFVIKTENVSIRELEPEEQLTGTTRVFWSTRGFAFEEPGKYNVELRIVWTAQGTPLAVKASLDLWVNYPQTTADNDAAATLLHPEVGKYVALGGGADHLVEAVERIQHVASLEGEGDEAGPRVLRGYADLAPAGRRTAVARSGGSRRRERAGRGTTRGGGE
jgi:hypothetical protein